MFKIYVKKSAFGNGSEKKSDKKNFEKLKAEVIAILEKKDSEELKKAIEVFSKSEAHYTYLAKSDNGEWIEKAGYGVGTIRIWKGKKYKKISASPTRWVRVFDKEDRGAKSSMTRLINRVKNCKDENELYQFCMSNHALFQDENGVDLPIMDKLRAAIDIKKEKITGESENYGTYEGNGVTREKQNEFKTHDKITKEEADLHKVGRKLSQIPTSELKKEKDKYQRLVDNKTRNKVDHHNNFIFHDSYKQHLDAINAELEKRSAAKNTENKESEKYDDDAAFEEYKKLVTKENPTNEDHSRVGELVLEHFKHSDKSWPGGAKLRAENAAKKTTDSKVLSNGKTIKEVREKYGIKTDDNKAYKGKLATQKQIDEATKVAEKTELNREEMLKKPITRIQQYANSNVDDFDGGIDKFIEYKAEIQPEGVSMNEVGKEFARLINHNVARKIWADYENGALIINENGYFESKKDSDSKTYWIQDKGNNRITNEDAKNRIKSNLSQIDAYNSLIADSDKADSIKWNSKKDQLENENKNLMDKMNSEDRKEMESEAEKHQNRSNAMKGNQNAKKWGLSDDDVEKMQVIKDKVEKKFKELYGDKKLTHYNEISNRKDILTDMIRRAKDPQIRKLANTLWSMDGKMPEEYLADTTERLEKVVDESVSKDAKNKANAAAWEIGGMNYYWRSHIDEHQAEALTEYESLANILESNKGEIDKDGKKYISDALNVLNEMKKNYASDYYRKFDFSKPNDTKQDDLINRYTELAKKYGADIPEPPKEEPKGEKKSSSTKRAEDYVSKYAGKEINSKPVEITKIVDDGERSGFYTFEFKSGNDTYKMTYDLGFGGKQDKPSIKKIGSSELEPENKTSNVTMDKAIEKYATDKQIKNTINKISDEDFASEDENRLFMNGTYQDNGYKIATDGRILSMIKSDYPDSEEGKIKGTKKGLKNFDKRLKNLEKTLSEREGYLEKEKQLGEGTNRYKRAFDAVEEVKQEIEKIKNKKESGFIDGQFPNYKKVIPSMSHSNLESLSGFENFNQILKVAKVAAAYKKTNGNCSVKVGDRYYEPEQLVKVISMAEKHGLKNVVSQEDRNDGPVEFNGDDGSIVMMPMRDNQGRVFDVETGKVTVEDESDKSVENFLSSIGDKKSDIKKALFDLISLIDDEPDEEESEKDGESYFFDKDELTDYSDNDASQPELFNSTQYKVADALNSVFGC